MGLNFADFKPKEKVKSEEKVTSQQTSKEEDKIRGVYNELKDLDSSALNKKLREEVANQKKSGQFDYNMLSSSVESMRSFLPEETYRNLQNLLKDIK